MASNELDATPAPLRCVSDEYDSSGDVPYESVGDFERMCMELYGEAPALRETPSGDYIDESGRTILTPFLS